MERLGLPSNDLSALSVNVGTLSHKTTKIWLRRNKQVSDFIVEVPVASERVEACVGLLKVLIQML